MKVLFLYPQWTGSYGIFSHFARRASTYPPLNLALLGAIAEAHGHEVKIIDGQAQWLNDEKIVEQALAWEPDFVGFTGYSPFYHIQVRVAGMLKARGCKAAIAIGGSHVTIVKQEGMVPEFDFGFVGEAEECFPQFLDTLGDGGDFSEVPGLMWRKDGALVFNGPAPALKTLDPYPLPARHLLDMSLYRMGTMKGRFNFTTIQTTRGCPWKCIFCASESLNTTRVLRRKPEAVVDEIKQVHDTYGITHYSFVDDVLTLDRDHVFEICDRLDAAGLKITFEGSTRANLVDEEVIERLSRSGLIRLSFGLETVDSEMRRTMKKKVPLKYYENANRLCNKYGVEALNSVMLGLPGETRETVKKTLEFLRNAREVKQANFAIAVPYPGTELYEMAVHGDQGIRLETHDFSKFYRYGSAVTTVNDLSPEDLLELQNDGFVSIYAAPWRWIPMVKKHGIMGAAIMLVRVARIVARKMFKNEFSRRLFGAAALRSAYSGR